MKEKIKTLFNYNDNSKIRNNCKKVLIGVLAILPIICLYILEDIASREKLMSNNLGYKTPILALFVFIFLFISLYAFFSPKQILHGFGIIFTIFFPAIVYVLTEWVSYMTIRKTIQYFFDSRFYLMIVILIVISMVYWILNLIISRPWISATILSPILIILSYINVLKLHITGDPLLPWDLLFAKNMGDVAGFASGGIIVPYQLIVSILLLVGIIFVMAKSKVKIKNVNVFLRIIICVVFAVCVFLASSIEGFKNFVFDKCYINLSASFVQSTVYSRNGFIGGFWMNYEGVKKEREGYSKDAVNAIISNYDNDVLTSDFEKPDVIVLLSETLYDVTRLNGVEYDIDPMKNVREIMNKSVSGTMLQASGIGGGTVRSEFEVLTGISLKEMKTGILPYATYIASSDNKVISLANHFKDMGYSTTAVHTYDKTFYSRSSAYEQMGFDKFIGEQDMDDAEISDTRRQFITDKYFMNKIIEQLESNSDSPNFVFGISMENHGQFPTKYENYDDHVIGDGGMSPYAENTLNQFIKSEVKADEAIKQLYDYIQNREKPTVLMIFGDHAPMLGENSLVFTQTNTIKSASNWDNEDNYTMYSTPFLITSNYKNDVKDLGDVSDYFLGTYLLDYMNAPKNRYWNFLTDYRSYLRVSNQILNIDIDGNFINESKFDKKTKKMLDYHALLSYDALMGKRYINDLLD